MKDSVTIALVANTSWSIYNFRLGLIRALKAKGINVLLIAPIDNYTSKLIAEGFHFIPLSLENYGINPFKEIKIIYQLYKIYKKEKPDLIFHYTIKPNLYGTIASWLNKVPSIAITTGLGQLVSTKNLFVKSYGKLMYRLTGRIAQEVWFLNQSDRNFFLKNNLITIKKTRLLPSEGVDTKRFRSMPKLKKNDGITRFLFAGRLITEKGIYEYIETARHIKKSNPEIVFQVLGFIEPKNPSSVNIRELKVWQEEGVIEFLGATEDVRPFIAAADCIVLPSYREGISRILLEAGAMSKPMISTKVPGCQEVITDKVSGFLSEPKSTKSLIKSIEKFIALSEEDITLMGKLSRDIIISDYSEARILEIYKKVLLNMIGIKLPNLKNKTRISLHYKQTD